MKLASMQKICLVVFFVFVFTLFMQLDAMMCLFCCKKFVSLYNVYAFVLFMSKEDSSS